MIRCISCGAEYGLDEVIYTYLESVTLFWKLYWNQTHPRIYLSAEKIPCGNIRNSCCKMNQEIISLDEGGTPFIKCNRLGERVRSKPPCESGRIKSSWKFQGQ